MCRNGGDVLRAWLVTTLLINVVLTYALNNPIAYISLWPNINLSPLSIPFYLLTTTSKFYLISAQQQQQQQPPPQHQPQSSLSNRIDLNLTGRIRRSDKLTSFQQSIIPENIFQFRHSIYNVSIPENSIGKTYANQPPNEDRLGITITPEFDVKYRIISGDKDKVFKAEERIVGDFAFLAIRTRTGNVILNREKIEEYHLVVKAFGTLHRRHYITGNNYNNNNYNNNHNNNDGDKISLETETQIYVKVLDRNDLSPLFYPTEYSITVPEDLSLHKSILKVNAEDADLGINGEIYYSFLDDIEYFGIHPTSGIITLTRPLKFTDRSIHNLIVVATDRGSTTNNNGLNQASKALVHVKVKQVNLYVPDIYVQSLPDITENSNANIYGIVRVEDKDVGIHGKIKSLEIVDGDPDGHFRIRPTSKSGEYNIEIHHLLDREQTPQGYNLTLRAIDCGIPPRQSYKVIPVHLSDINDNAPVFSKEIYEVSVPETSPPNTPVIRLKVTDRDEGKNALVSLEIVGGNEGGEFRVNAETGMLYTTVLLDAESKAFYTLTVSAIDQGNTGTRKQSSAKVKINVQDTNDNDPIFEVSNVTVWVDENEPAGTRVTKVTARDRDSGENAYISYSIANLNPVPFDIDHFSGEVRTSKLIDYESMRREYVLRVRASDWGLPYRRQTEMQLVIKVRDVNDNRPQFERIDCVGNIPKYLSIGTEILTLSAIDFDAGNFISYRMVSGNEDGCFNLDSTSGILSIGCDLMDVFIEQREINVTATDGTHFADIMKIHVNLLSPKKQQQLQQQYPYHHGGNNQHDDLVNGGNANGNSASNSLSQLLNSIDDSDAVDSIGVFKCKDMGVARRQAEMFASAEKNNQPGRQFNNDYLNRLNGTDDFAMMPSRYGENVHTPEFIDFPNEIKVNETVELGTTIGWIKARDRDLGYNGKLVFGISGGDDDSVFRLDPDDGELKIIGYLDREREMEYVLNITVYDLGKPQKSISKILPVTILDENDNAPKFEKSLASFRVAENALNGTIIFRLNATDADAGDNAKITYSLITDTKDFRVDPVTGVLSICQPLDHEKQELYELKIRATDGDGKPDIIALSSEAIVRITVDDINDNAPIFSLNDYTVRIREDIPRGTVVAVVTAMDLDSGPGGEIQYSLSDDSEQSFKIDKFSGTIRNTKLLDFEERQIHSLIVRASDRGTPALFSETSVIIEIIDVNENRFAPQFDDFVLIGDVNENQPSGAHVMSAIAKDADAPGPDSRITYSIIGGDGLGIFSIDHEGLIRTTATLDLETKSHYWLTVCAHDQAVVPLHSCVQVFIRVNNENDNVPLTENAVYYPSVPESSLAGVKVLQLIADDRDIDPLQQITYRIISGNPEGFFAINSSSGLITTTARKLDRENQPEHILEVSISDNGTPQLSSTTRVVVTVEDINDHSPEFEQKFYKVQIPVNAKIEQALFQNDKLMGGGGQKRIIMTDSNLNYNKDGLVIFDESPYDGDHGITSWEISTENDLIGNKPFFRVLAIDRDSGENGRVTYTIKSGKGKNKFRIHPDTGVIYAAKNFEPDTEYDLIIRAEDNGIIKKLSQTTRVSVVVIQIPEHSSEHKPQIKTNDQHVEITENDNAGFLVTLIQAYDEDNQQLWYDIIDGDDNNDFYIGRDNGNILLAKNLDWETKKEYNLTISITDGVHMITTQVLITVIDINDHRPEFTESIYRIDISENIEEGTEILQLHATDLDEDKKLFFSLHATRDPISLRLFHVNSVTGSILLNEQLDRELIAEHVLIVIVKDQGTPAKRNYAKVIITVHDHNDHVPEFTSKIIEGKVYETAAIGSNVVQVYAIDRDIGDNAKLAYSIVSGNIGNVFNIDIDLGIISVSKELDMNTLPEYMLQVKVSDHGKPSLYAQIPVHIMIVMADNAPPRFFNNEPAAEIFENLPIGTFVMHIEARSTSSIVFDIIDGNENNIFFINPSTGVVTTKDSLDYERNKFYNLTIRTTNMASASATCSAIVHVLDRNDNAPYFTQQLFKGEVSEAAQIASLVIIANDTIKDQSIPLVIKAYDIDSGSNALLHYDIVETMPRRYFHIDSSTGAIKTVMLLDHEKIPVFNFHVKVSDLGNPSLSSETMAKVQIIVTDVNDCAPVFSQKNYNVTLLLPTYENVAVIQVNATDQDSLENSTLRYDIIEGNKDGVFAIDAKTGVITTRNVEQIGEYYKLHIRVSDGKFSKVAYVNVLVEESANSGLAFQRSDYEGSILENSTKITIVTVVNVIGSSLNEHVEFHLLNPTDMFRIGLTSGAIETTGIRFDRELRDNYELIVEARSHPPDHERPRVAHTIVNVTILDVNDNCPMFVNLPYYAVVSIDDPKGSIITKVHALDMDSYENGEVRYEMKRGHGELFKVDRKSGEITLKQTLEGHNRDYELLIAAYDGNTTPCSTDVTVHVKVIDKSMPVFNKQFYSDTVPENIELHSPLSVAIQAESPLGRKLIYTIVKGNELEEFTVDFNTAPDSTNGPCAIYVVDELDYETKQNYELIIRATDSVSGVSAEVPVSVLVQDVNDCPPEIEHDSYNISVSEGSTFGTAILKVLAKDNDTGINQMVMYSLQTDTKNTSEYFHMDPVEGIVYLKKSLDHETLPAHHFTVIATDKGVPSLSSTAHVWVSVLDMNDNQPKFEQLSYSCVLSEHAQRGQFVIVVSASDPDYVDHDNLIYTIAEGNELQTYSIDPITGIITLVNMQNFAEKHLTVLNVSVTDGVYTSFTRVKINILPANLHNPQFSHLLYDVQVNENQLAGRLVIIVKAIDKDFGEYSTIVYDIFSDEMKEYFSIDKITGEITTKIRLNREERKTYEIPIIATDMGGRSGFTTVKVSVGDENDNAPEFLLKEYKTSIYGNFTLNTTFLRVTATDADDNQNAVITYIIYDSQNTGVTELFAINENTGALSLRKNAEQWKNEMFQFFVRAHDGGTPTLHSDVSVNIYIMSESDQTPVFEKKDRTLFLSERSPPGTVITRLRLSDPNITVNYRIISRASHSPSMASSTSADNNNDDDDYNGGNVQFSINDIGELRLAKTLDRELIDLHYIGVLAESDSSPSLSTFIGIHLHVQDENDNSPIFESNRYSLMLAENVEKGSTIMKVTAHDADSGSNGDVRYSLANDIGELANLFDIDVHTGWISILIQLDKEKKGEYVFQVIATDNGQPQKHSARTTVSIKLKDYNDCPPQFKSAHYYANISEDSLPGKVILQIQTTDKDIDLNTPIEYYIINGDPLSQFTIRQSGELFNVKPLDRESIDRYELIVIVTDGRFTATTNVTVIVLDANDNPPYCLKYRYKDTLNEGVHVSSFVLQIEANDADEPQNAKLRYYLTGTGSDDFALDKDTGNLRTARQLDREQQSKYYLIAHVQDREHSGWECSSQIEILVSDLNDNAPQFSLPKYTVTLPEDAEVGTLVTKVHATDLDIGINRKIQYKFLDSNRDHFRIAKDSGIITLAKPLDREQKAIYNLTVQADDQGTPKLSTKVNLIVNVQDINDNPPEFTSKQYFASIPEVAQIGSDVIKVLATSKDTGINAEIYYSIIGGNEQKRFLIDNKTGQLQLSDMVDYERTRDYFLTIQAVDGGTPPLSNLATINISITDSNDNAPIFQQNSYTATIREDAEIGDKILQLQANDLDANDNGRISYHIERGDRLHQFVIDSDTGYISVQSALDRESVSTYVLEVQAEDNGQPRLSNYVLVNIHISDANDNPPQFTETNYTIVVQEDKPLGYTLMKFDITDADTNPNTAPYTFDFRTGNEHNEFRLEQDGILRTATHFNHKMKDTYLLEIRVFDNGTPPLYSDAWVHIRVIEESRYPPVIIPQEITINTFQDEFNGGLIGRVYASDQDTYDTLQYALAPSIGQSYSPSNLFNITKTNGTLYALPRLDVGDYRINVTVTDGKFMAYTIVKISIDLITDDMLRNALIIRFSKVSAGQFILSHRKTFIRSVRTILGTKLKDIIIIGVQPVQMTDQQTNNMISYKQQLSGNTPHHRQHRFKRMTSSENLRNISHLLSDKTNSNELLTNDDDYYDEMRDKRQTQQISDLDVLFTVRKSTGPSSSTGSQSTHLYYTSDELRQLLSGKLDDMEESINLQIEEIHKSKCTTKQDGECTNGKCYDKFMGNTEIDTIITDVTSFVSIKFQHTTECECLVGFGGEHCATSINECARQPCPLNKICVPDISQIGYHCTCPEGFTGPTCDRDIMKCSNVNENSNNANNCYIPRNPVSFNLKSYAQYRIDKTVAKKHLEDQLMFQLRIRTVQPTGNLMYAAGKIDYNILEIVNGEVQYRFELGSGEGMISVSSIHVADGQWHEIRLEREGNSAKLVVDGKHVAQGNAPGVNGALNLQSSDLYLGAEVRQHPTVLGFEDIQRGFIGCMDDIKISRVTMPLHMTGGSSIAVLRRISNIEFNCDPATILQPIGVCGTQPCANGGTCKDLGGNKFECVCHTRFAGQYCTEDLDPCASSPCLFGGKCRTDGIPGNYTCECPPQMHGKRCDFGRFCSPNPCRNGGVCEEGDNGPLCMCRGYKGITCEIDVDECEKQPCGSGATCINEAGSFRCICPPDLTGSSCGDPLYSNSISTKLRNLSSEHLFGIILGVGCLFTLIIIAILCRFCKKKSRNQHINNINNETKKDNIVLNSAQGQGRNEHHKRGSKMSNLEIIQQINRPVSYTSSANNDNTYFGNTLFVNNLDTLRSYGSAGDELENVPPEYRKLNLPTNQHININGHNHHNQSNINDVDLLHKQSKWTEQLQLQQQQQQQQNQQQLQQQQQQQQHQQNQQHQPIQQPSTFDNKINNVDLKRISPIGGDHQQRCATLKATGILPGRLLNVPLPNPNIISHQQYHQQQHQHQQQQQPQTSSNSISSSPLTVTNVSTSSTTGYEDSQTGGSHGAAYNWDCSDWLRRSQNPLPNITEVPGSEVPDSSSFHSNESNESHPKNIMIMPPIHGPVDPARDIETLNEEELQSDFVDDSEYEGSQQHQQQPHQQQQQQSSSSMVFDHHSNSIPILNPLDSGSEDYRFSTADSYLRHPNSYLPRYNINNSETDGECAPLTGLRALNGLDIGPQQIIESDEEDVVPSYGFPIQQKRNRNRRDGRDDLDMIINNGGEHNSLLGNQHGASNSDLSTHLCEIDDSECDDEQDSTKTVKWASSVQTTQV